MTTESQTELVRSLALGPAPEVTRSVHVKRRGPATEPANPDGLIVGGNMLAFSDKMPQSARQAVSLNLLFAQEAAKGDPVAASPDLWVTRHDMVFQNPLGWFTTGGASQFTRYENAGLAVHQAILPLLTAALGPAASAAALIVTGLTQLQKIDEDQPWVTLFDREARRFEHCEYRFAVAEAVGETVSLRIVAFRFAATAKRFQVLFFKTKDVDVEFTFATRTLGIDLARLEKLRPALQARLDDRAASLIDTIDLPAFR